MKSFFDIKQRKNFNIHYRIPSEKAQQYELERIEMGFSSRNVYMESMIARGREKTKTLDLLPAIYKQLRENNILLKKIIAKMEK